MDTQVNPYDAFVSLAVALGIGIFLGLQCSPTGFRVEPTWEEIRLFPLISLVGSVSSLLGTRLGQGLASVCFGAIIVFLGIARTRDSKKSRGWGLDEDLALLATFLLGVLSQLESVQPLVYRMQVVAIFGVAVAALLSCRRRVPRR